MKRASQALAQEEVESDGQAIVAGSQLEQLRVLVQQLSTVTADEKPTQSAAEKNANETRNTLLRTTKLQLLGIIEELS